MLYAWCMTLFVTSVAAFTRSTYLGRRSESNYFYLGQGGFESSSSCCRAEVRSSNSNKVNRKNNSSARTRNHNKSGNHRKNLSNRNNKDNLQVYRTINGELIKAESVNGILDIFVRYGGLKEQSNVGRPCFNAVNYSTAIHRIAKFSGYDKQKKIALTEDVRFGYFYGQLALYLINSPASFKNREISNILWATAKLGLKPKHNAPKPHMQQIDVFKKVSNLTMQSIEAVIKTRDKSNIPKISELVRLIISGVAERLVEILFESPDLITSATSQELANIIYALAIREEPHPVIESLVHRLLDVGESGNSIFSVNGNPGQEENKRNRALLVKSQEISNCFYSLAKLSSTSEVSVLSDYSRLIQYLYNISANEIHGEVNYENLNKFKNQELGNTIWALATLTIQDRIDETHFDILSQTVTIMLKYLTSDNESYQQLKPFNPQEVSNLIWAVANLKACGVKIDRDLTISFLLKFLEYIRLEVFPPQEINNSLWGVAKLCKCLDVSIEWHDNNRSIVEAKVSNLVLKAEEVLMTRNCNKFTPQDVSTVLYSAASLGYPIHNNLYHILIQKFLENSKYFIPRESSNIAWSIATAGYDRNENPNEYIDQAFEIISTKLKSRPQYFKPQEIKDCCWAHSKSNVQNHELFYKMCKYWNGVGTMKDFACQSLGGVSWAMTKQCLPSTSTSRDMTNGKQAVYKKLYKSIFQSDADLMYKSMRLILDESLAKLKEFSSRDLNNLAYSLSILGIAHAPLMHEIFKELSIRIKEHFTNPLSKLVGSEIAVMIWSLAVLNFGPLMSEEDKIDLTNSINELIAKEVYFQDFELLNLTWGAVVLGTYPTLLLEKMITVFEETRAVGGWESQQEGAMLYIQTISQLDPVCLEIFDFPTVITGLYDEEDDDIDDDADIIDSEQALQPSHLQSSRFQSSVFETFKGILSQEAGHIDIQEEYPIECLYVDIAIPEENLVIECDGPSHYCIPIHLDLSKDVQEDMSNKNPALWSLRKDWNNGATALKDRMLQLMGWRVLHVPYWEWNEARRAGQEERERHLKSLLFSELNL